MDRLLQAIVVVVGVPAVTVGYIVLAERALVLLPGRRQPGIRPWLWLLPALSFLAVFLVYPSLNTIYLSFRNATGERFVGLQNYLRVLTDPGTVIA
ncbi:MAG: alpha-glucoside transport system permease protein, partial [Chloroflexota bacterium]|nr:alpha-glucoside transport system permease protein [Chloroflexota bacterium]